MRPRCWLPTTLLLLAILALAPVAGARADDRVAQDYLPADAVMAAGYRVEHLGLVFDDFLAFMEMQGDFDPDTEMEELRAWEEEVGVSLRNDLLARVGGEIVAAVSVGDLDGLLETFRNGGPDPEAFLRELVFVAGVSESAKLDEALKAALASAGLELSISEEGLHSIRETEGSFPGIFFRYVGGLAVGAFSPETLDKALERGEGRAGFSRAEDFGRVLARLGPSPDMFVYFNMPRIRSLLDASPAVQELIASDLEAAELYERWVERPGWEIGAGWFTYRSSEGTVRKSFFPSQGHFTELIGTTPLGAMWGGMGLEMAPVGRILSKLSQASGSGNHRKAMSDLRTIGTAVEMWSIDEGRYPGSSGGLVGLESIRSLLEPMYISRLPVVDPWGNPYLFWSDGETYTIVSGGDDGVVQWQMGGTGAGETSAPGADIVFGNGSFLTYPAR